MTVKMCSVADCSKPHAARGYCDAHYRRWRKHGNPHRNVRVDKQRAGKTCSIVDCNDPVRTTKRGFCIKHDQRFLKTGDPLVTMSGAQSAAELVDGRTCHACNETKPLDQFVTDAGCRNGRTGECKPCHGIRKKRESEAQSEAVKEARRAARSRPESIEQRRNYALVYRYGITVEEYESLLSIQGGACAMCGRGADERNGKRNLAVDHDHACCPGRKSCGRCVRGLLCQRCNNALSFIEDAVFVESAQSYLTRHQAKVSS